MSERRYTSLISGLIESGSIPDDLDISTIDLRTFAEFASNNYVYLRVFEILEELDIDIPSSIISDLETLRNKNDAMIGLMRDIRNIFELKGIDDFVFVKTVDGYPDMGSDIDIYSNHSGRELYQHLLSDDRFRTHQQTLPERLLGKGKCLPANRDTPGIDFYPKLSRIGETWFRNENKFVDNCVTVTIKGEDIKVPSPEDTLLIRCVHEMYFNGGVPYGVLWDLKNQIENARHFDWSYVCAQIEHSGARSGAYLMLRMMNEIFAESVVPQGTLVSILPDAARQDDIWDESLVETAPYKLPIKKLLPLFSEKAIADLPNVSNSLLVAGSFPLAIRNYHRTFKKGQAYVE